MSSESPIAVPNKSEVLTNSDDSRSSGNGYPAMSHENVKEVRRPWGLEWRSSIWFITLAVGAGVTTDVLIYAMIIPVIPFQLQHLGYDGVSGLVGWLLFAFSTALVVSTPFIAYLSERFKNRRIPLLCGQVALIGSQVMLMEAPKFWVMALARIFQGISGSVVWVVGLALVCDTVPEAIVGKQLGLVMIGMSLGTLVGPPVSGALNDRFGFHGPFIFGIILTFIDFICRLLIIERQDAVRWDQSLKSLVKDTNASRERVYGAVDVEKCAVQVATSSSSPSTPANEIDELNGQNVQRVPTRQTQTANEAQQSPAQLSILGLLLTLLKSSRAMAPIVLALVYGIIVTTQEPVVPVYLQATYGLDSSKVGLVYIAAVVPSFISAPLSGWYADRGGTRISTLVCMFGTMPFWILVFIKGPLAYFVVMFGCLNFFSSAAISPVTAELAVVTRGIEGVGYAHSYGAFNMAYGLGSALGPVISGQLYDHTSRGWMAVMLLNAGVVFITILYTLSFFGESPPLQKLWAKVRARRVERSDADQM